MPSHTEALINILNESLQHPPDLLVHPFAGPRSGGWCLYIETLSDTQKIEQRVLCSLVARPDTPDGGCAGDREQLAWLAARLPVVSVIADADPDVCRQSLLEGKCLLLFEGNDHTLILNTCKSPHRAISEPESETTVKGPREGFTEDLQINLSLVRKRIRSAGLRLEQHTIGTKTETRVVLVYMTELANPAIVGQFRQRLSDVRLDSLLDNAYLEEWMENKTWTPFPTLLSTERPDIVCARVLEGDVAVMMDGSPMVLIGPVTFFQFFTAPEDYYQRSGISTLLRWLRFLSFFLAIFVPGLYVAIVTFHQELLPTPLLINMAAQREGIPFPTYIEAFIMLITFEVLREAGLRMPRVAGQAISIVGALVLGQAAVEAGLVSPAMVIVVGITAIANFVSPAYSFGISQRILQFGFLILASCMGMFGLLCGALFTIVHLASLRSFGVSYLAPVAPATPSDWKDSLVRLPRPALRTYPRMSHIKRKRR